MFDQKSLATVRFDGRVRALFYVFAARIGRIHDGAAASSSAKRGPIGVAYLDENCSESVLAFLDVLKQLAVESFY